MNRHLFLIDPQRDFCDKAGSLFVPGADQDMERVSKLLETQSFSNVTVTLDSHHQLHIGNPLWFQDSEGNHPSPFTLVTSKDFLEGKWHCTLPEMSRWTSQYLEQLEQKGQMHCIWPYHCLIGTEGHAICTPIQDALLGWEQKNRRIASKVTKGSNPRVEHFSVFKAEVPDPSDPSTLTNTQLVNRIERSDEIWIAGEALSHCVMSSLRDLVQNFTPESLRKTTLLIDGTSMVPDPVGAPGLFSNPVNEFLRDLRAKGLKILKTSEV